MSVKSEIMNQLNTISANATTIYNLEPLGCGNPSEMEIAVSNIIKEIADLIAFVNQNL